MVFPVQPVVPLPVLLASHGDIDVQAVGICNLVWLVPWFGAKDHGMGEVFGWLHVDIDGGLFTTVLPPLRRIA